MLFRRSFWTRLLLGLVVAIALLLAIPIIVLWQPAPFLPYTFAHGTPPPESPQPQTATICVSTQDIALPPCNPSLANSVWPITHSGSYAQGSSALPGPQAEQSFLSQHLDLGGVPITVNFSPPYADGGVAAWVVPISPAGYVAKIDHDAFALIDLYDPRQRETETAAISLSSTGAYTALDRYNRLLVGRDRSLEVYSDEVAGDRFFSHPPSTEIGVSGNVLLP